MFEPFRKTSMQFLMEATMDPLIQGLLRADAYGHPVTHFEVLETHISWVILTGDFAYKLKKPVNYGFVDFTTLEQRRFCCQEELRLNRRLADDLYLEVCPIYGSRENATFCGLGEPIEYAVRMREFPQSALLPNVLARGELTGELLDRLAVDVARFQQQAPMAGTDSPFGSPELVQAPVTTTLGVLHRLREHAVTVRSLAAWCASEFEACRDIFAHRKSNGKIREGHGDMHLGNMLLRRGHIEVFDCLEFNPSLRWIDVLSEVAFLVMDLGDRRRPDLGWRFLNAWLEQTGDYAGLRLWAWYYCYRAQVRAKVAVLRGEQGGLSAEEKRHLDQQLAAYLQLAFQITQPSRPRLIITQGVSGSGKSFWTQRLAAERGWVRIRSDVERKRLAGTMSDPPRLSGEMYSADVTRQTYERLRELAFILLETGESVIVDATFLRQSQRQVFRDLARQINVPCCIIAFTADVETMRQRITVRQLNGNDPSDATLEVLEQQLAAQESITAEEGWPVISVDTNSPNTTQTLATEIDERLG